MLKFLVELTTGNSLKEETSKVLNVFISRPPNDCLQYFTGTSGTFKTFNYDSQDATPHLGGQRYVLPAMVLVIPSPLTLVHTGTPRASGKRPDTVAFSIMSALRMQIPSLWTLKRRTLQCLQKNARATISTSKVSSCYTKLRPRHEQFIPFNRGIQRLLATSFASCQQVLWFIL